MTELRTSWSKEAPPYGAFDDYVIIEVTGTNERILIRPEEFDFLMNQLYDNWMLKKSNYIQILKEWNENTGFEGIAGKTTVLLDVADTIVAVQQAKGVEELEFAKMTQEDISLLLSFLGRNKNSTLVIWKE